MKRICPWPYYDATAGRYGEWLARHCHLFPSWETGREGPEGRISQGSAEKRDQEDIYPWRLYLCYIIYIHTRMHVDSQIISMKEDSVGETGSWITAENAHHLLSASWGPRRAGGIAQSAGLRAGEPMVCLPAQWVCGTMRRQVLSSDAGKRGRVLLPQTFCSVQPLEGHDMLPLNWEGLSFTEPTHSNVNVPVLRPWSSPPGGQVGPQAAAGGV